MAAGSFCRKNSQSKVFVWDPRQSSFFWFFFSIKAIPLGGNFYLLTASDDEDLRKALEDDAKGLSKWFVDLRPWDLGFSVRERSVWLNVSGVPPHAWKEDFFQNLARVVGRFIDLDE